MKKFLKVIFCLIIVFTSFIGNYSSEAANQVEGSYMIIIDASGSMSANSRMERAKDAAEAQLENLRGKNVEVGLIAFYGCGDIRVLHELTNNVDDILPHLRAIQPSGTTPLADAIGFGGSYLKANGIGLKGKLIVYTDGVDTCSGNYEGARDAIEGLEIDLWGIDLSEEDKKVIEDGIGLDPIENIPTEPTEPVEDNTLDEIFLSNFPSELNIGETHQITLQARWSDGSISTINSNDATYSSSRVDRVTVSDSGVLNAISQGTSYIDIEYNGDKFRSLININPAPTLVDFYLINDIPSNMQIGETYVISGMKASWSDGSVTDISSGEVSFSSTRSDRLVINPDGEIKAIDSGTSFVDLTYKGKTVRTLVTIEPGATLSEFYLDTPIPDNMVIGDNYQISGLKAKWSDGSETAIAIGDVAISSSRTDRVTVSSAGELEAIESGTSYIDVEYKGKTIRTLVTVEAAATLSGFYMDALIPSKMIIGDKYQITGLKSKWSDGSETDIAIGDVAISSSRTDRVTVSSTGELEAKESGTSYIDVEYKGKTIRTLVTVEAAATLSGFYMDASIPSKMIIGDKYQITGLKAKWSDGSVTDVAIGDVTISSSRADRVTVSPTGELESIGSGTSYIDAKYKGKTIRTLVTVEAEATLSSFYLDTSIPSKMIIGDKYQITGLKAKWSDGSETDVAIGDVTISSSRSDRVTVSSTGELAAIGSGTSYIDVEYKGKTIRTLVTVEAEATLSSFYLDASIPSKMIIGDKYQITGLKAKWSDGSETDVAIGDVTISSSRADRVTVSPTGELEAIGIGTSYIDIKYKGKTIRNLITISSL